MRFLKVGIGVNEFGVALEQVREVVSFTGATPIPTAPPHILGLASLRDEVIPIFDMRIHLKLKPTLTHDTAVVVCKLGETIVGVVVDAIHNVVDTPDESLTGENNGAFTNEYVSNVCKQEDTLVLILNMNKIINAKDISVAKLHQGHLTAA